jgi:hypothetical protein
MAGMTEYLICTGPNIVFGPVRTRVRRMSGRGRSGFGLRCAQAAHPWAAVE